MGLLEIKTFCPYSPLIGFLLWQLKHLSGVGIYVSTLETVYPIFISGDGSDVPNDVVLVSMILFCRYSFYICDISSFSANIVFHFLQCTQKKFSPFRYTFGGV